MKAKKVLSWLIFASVVALIFACDPYREGNKYLEQKQYKKAVEFFESKLKTNANDPVLHNQLGFAYSKLKKYGKAIEHYKKAIELKPDYPEAHYNLGIVYKNRLRFEEALKEFDQAIKARPNYAKAYNARALVNTYLGKFDLAKKDLQKALEIEPNNEIYKSNLDYCKRMEEINKALIKSKEKAEQKGESQKTSPQPKVKSNPAEKK